MNVGFCYRGPFEGILGKSKDNVLLLQSKSYADTRQVMGGYIWVKDKWVLNDDITFDLKKGLLKTKPTIIDLGQ